VNDFINTTLGGIALGEMFHRAAWLVRDTTSTGKPRLVRELVATVLDPLTGANRFLSGDASRVSEKPRDMGPSGLGAVASAGVLWQGDDAHAYKSTGEPFLEADLRYGKDAATRRSRTPYEVFTVSLRLGGGQAISDVRVRGQLLGQPLGGGSGRRGRLTLFQAYDYASNKAYELGGQSIIAGVGRTFALSARSSMTLAGFGGVIVLGAVDSLGEPGSERDYDYGPGTAFAGMAAFDFGGRVNATVSYQGFQIYVVDGARAAFLPMSVSE
jgi:hypothetical protein